MCFRKNNNGGGKRACAVKNATSNIGRNINISTNNVSYDHQTWQDGDLRWEGHTRKIMWHFDKLKPLYIPQLLERLCPLNFYGIVTLCTQVTSSHMTLWSCGTAISRDKLKLFYLHCHSIHGQQTWPMMMNSYCGMVDRRKAFSLISSRDHCQRSSPSWISDTPRAGFELAQNLSSGFVEWSCAVVITTTPRRHK